MSACVGLRLLRHKIQWKMEKRVFYLIFVSFFIRLALNVCVCVVVHLAWDFCGEKRKRKFLPIFRFVIRVSKGISNVSLPLDTHSACSLIISSYPSLQQNHQCATAFTSHFKEWTQPINRKPNSFYPESSLNNAAKVKCTERNYQSSENCVVQSINRRLARIIRGGSGRYYFIIQPFCANFPYIYVYILIYNTIFSPFLRFSIRTLAETRASIGSARTKCRIIKNLMHF